jgi:hypothetical protein
MRRIPKTHKKLPTNKASEPDFYELTKKSPLPPLEERSRDLPELPCLSPLSPPPPIASPQLMHSFSLHDVVTPPASRADDSCLSPIRLSSIQNGPIDLQFVFDDYSDQLKSETQPTPASTAPYIPYQPSYGSSFVGLGMLPPAVPVATDSAKSFLLLQQQQQDQQYRHQQQQNHYQPTQHQNVQQIYFNSNFDFESGRNEQQVVVHIITFSYSIFIAFHDPCMDV